MTAGKDRLTTEAARCRAVKRRRAERLWGMLGNRHRRNTSSGSTPDSGYK